ncbi:MAG: hypothetical protein JNJ88_15975 [Planctomycetes bacterium]|nr:hypothetical protein [Planctomycetota bacterium]
MEGLRSSSLPRATPHCGFAPTVTPWLGMLKLPARMPIIPPDFENAKEDENRWNESFNGLLVSCLMEFFEKLQRSPKMGIGLLDRLPGAEGRVHPTSQIERLGGMERGSVLAR